MPRGRPPRLSLADKQSWTPERAKAWQREWREANRGHLNKYSRLRRTTDVRHRAGDIVSQLRIRARRKGLEFTLTVDWVEERLRSGKCELTGEAFNMESKRRPSPFSPSVDRINALEGYTPNNCQMVLYCLNAAFGYWGREVTAMVMKIWLRNAR